MEYCVVLDEIYYAFVSNCNDLWTGVWNQDKPLVFNTKKECKNFLKGKDRYSMKRIKIVTYDELQMNILEKKIRNSF